MATAIAGLLATIAMVTAIAVAFPATQFAASSAPSEAGASREYGHLGITFTFFDPHCEHTHRRQFMTDGKGVLSDGPSVSSIRSAPCPQLTSLQDTRSWVTPWARR